MSATDHIFTYSKRHGHFYCGKCRTERRIAWRKNERAGYGGFVYSADGARWSREPPPCQS